MKSSANLHPKQDRFTPRQIEKKWQGVWLKNKTFSPNLDHAKKPFFNLMMFPYPSAEGMHVGNMYAHTGSDIFGRFKRMQGFQVFEPIGLDGFGIHSENYALKVGEHPMEQADKAEKNFYRQMHDTGSAFDWERTVETYKPDYYKWTQWLFIQMFKAGLAYRQKASVNFCPSCKTVLADEQVINGKCERCGSVVEKKMLSQWFFRITQYAERLLNNIDHIDWTEKVKIAQRQWIGKSNGALIDFSIDKLDCKINVFTTRPDTLFGATFMVLSPEHPIVNKILSREYSVDNQVRNDLEEYVKTAKSKTDAERTEEGKEKTGVFSGLYAINPVSNEKIPVWVADYVLMGYGTGAIMAVPAHDQRDFDFAKKYSLKITRVVEGSKPEEGKAFSGSGKLINSGSWNRVSVPEDIDQITKDLENRGIGKAETNYHLRDWLISRQRYWGPPIPMIYCEACAGSGKSWFDTEEAKSWGEMNSDRKLENGSLQVSSGWYPVPDQSLPVTLPKIDDFKPLGTGKAPLANHPEFYNVKCPGCGLEAKRETDVSDTFLDSAWYFLRYLATDWEDSPFPSEKLVVSENEKDSARKRSKFLPVHMYIGGAEHSVLHLLYSRFTTMVLHDLGYLAFEEPFTKFFAHGLLIKEGAKMSKSKGNVIIPDDYIDKYGSDTLRSYLMFLGPFNQGGDFYDTGIEGMHRFIRRYYALVIRHMNTDHLTPSGKERRQMMHRTIKRVTDDMNTLSYNTAIAALMEWYNFLSNEDSLSNEELLNFTKLLAPFAPHITEEVYHKITGANESESIHTTKWPKYDENELTQDRVVVVIQVNGKKKGEITLLIEDSRDQNKVEQIALEKIKQALAGKSVKRSVFVPSKIINFVV